MSMLPAAAAVEADRLVLGVNRARDRDGITRVAAGVGLEDPHLLGHWWDFLLAGTLTREVARLRTRYWPPEDVDTMLDRLLGGGLVRGHAGGLLASDQLAPVLHVIRDESARVARNAWAGHPDLVEVVAAGASRMAAAAGDESPVVVAHRAIPVPEDDHLALYCRLVTVRYIRQHDHAAAWSAHDLTAAQMRVYSDLWEGKTVADEASGRDELQARGLITPDGDLTERGRNLREQIEAETLERSARTYETLGADASQYLAAIRALPTPARDDHGLA